MSLIQIRLVGSSESSWLRTSACPSASAGISSSTSSRSPSASSPSGRLRSRKARLAWVSGIGLSSGQLYGFKLRLGGDSHVWNLHGGDQVAYLLDLRRPQRVVVPDRAGRLRPEPPAPGPRPSSPPPPRRRRARPPRARRPWGRRDCS